MSLKLYKITTSSRGSHLIAAPSFVMAISHWRQLQIDAWESEHGTETMPAYRLEPDCVKYCGRVSVAQPKEA